MKAQDTITELEDSMFSISSSRDKIKKYISDHPMSGRQKSILFGWGESNYNHRMRQKISDHVLIDCVKKLSSHEDETKGGKK